MEYLIVILIFCGFWFIGWLVLTISKFIDEKQAKIRVQVADEVLKSVDIEENISKYKKKLKYIGYEKEELIDRYPYYETQAEALVTKILGHCPECKDGYLQSRKGPYGKFLGCSNYPRCKHTEVDRVMKKYKQIVGKQFWNDIKKAYF